MTPYEPRWGGDVQSILLRCVAHPYAADVDASTVDGKCRVRGGASFVWLRYAWPSLRLVTVVVDPRSDAADALRAQIYISKGLYSLPPSPICVSQAFPSQTLSLQRRDVFESLCYSHHSTKAGERTQIELAEGAFNRLDVVHRLA
ncbi:hypothetical protein MRX96_015710 [Rhipicephalus microplus]